MTAFEQELIRAIEHGCPECGNDLTAGIRMTMWHDLSIGFNEDKEDIVELDWQGWSDKTDDEYIVVKCVDPDCGTELWTAEGGWIPELQEIVKGE